MKTPTEKTHEDITSADAVDLRMGDANEPQPEISPEGLGDAKEEE